MSKFKNELREALIHNSHEFFGKGRVFLSYAPADVGRGGRSAYWRASCPGYETEPNAHWMDHGNKTFVVRRYGADETYAQNKVYTLEKAKKWVEDKYGISEWAKDPFGAWGEASFVKARIKELKTTIKYLPFRTGDRVLVQGQDEVRIVARINRADSISLEGDVGGYGSPTYDPSELTKVVE